MNNMTANSVAANTHCSLTPSSASAHDANAAAAAAQSPAAAAAASLCRGAHGGSSCSSPSRENSWDESAPPAGAPPAVSLCRRCCRCCSCVCLSAPLARSLPLPVPLIAVEVSVEGEVDVEVEGRKTSEVTRAWTAQTSAKVGLSTTNGTLCGGSGGGCGVAREGRHCRWVSYIGKQ